jgi:hypothetical protein
MQIPLLAPNISDDEYTHLDNGSYMSFEYDLEYYEHVNDDHEDVEPPHIPKWVHTALQVARDLMEDLVYQRRTWSQFEDPPHALTATEILIPMNCYMVLDSYQYTYVADVGNLFREAEMKEYISFLKNYTWDLVPLPSNKNIFICG